MILCGSSWLLLPHCQTHKECGCTGTLHLRACSACCRVSCFSCWMLPGLQHRDPLLHHHAVPVLDISAVILGKLKQSESLCNCFKPLGRILPFFELPPVQIRYLAAPSKGICTFNRKGSRAIFSGEWLLFRYLSKRAKPPQSSASNYSS